MIHSGMAPFKKNILGLVWVTYCVGHILPLRQHPYMATQILSFTNESVRQKVGNAQKIQCNSSFEIYTGVWLRLLFFWDALLDEWLNKYKTPLEYILGALDHWNEIHYFPAIHRD